MKSLHGVNCLLMTPFTERGTVDEESLCRLIDHVIEGGATSLVAMGKIGEFEILTMDERRETMQVVMDHVGGRVPVGFGIINASYTDGLIPVPDLKATNSFSRISDSGDLLRISSRLIQIWYDVGPLRSGGRGRLCDVQTSRRWRHHGLFSEAG